MPLRTPIGYPPSLGVARRLHIFWILDRCIPRDGTRYRHRDANIAASMIKRRGYSGRGSYLPFSSPAYKFLV